MTITTYQLLIYAGALTILFMTPGPVWVAIAARTMAGGFAAAWPLALGVAVGDALWPVLAILGVSLVVSAFAGFMTLLSWVASLIFITMGVLIIRDAAQQITADNRLTRPGIWPGFAAGVVVILSNPKAILFYMGVLPGFFDLTGLTRADIIAIVIISMIVPFLGNLLLALFVERAGRFLKSPKALKRTALTAGAMLIFVGVALRFI